MDTRKHLKKILPIIIHHKNCLNKGSQDFALIRQTIQMVALIIIAVHWLPNWAGAILGMAYLTACWTYGKAWDYFKGYDYEAEWSNKRNPSIEYIKRKV